MATEESRAVELTDASVRFGEVHALQGLSFFVRPGEMFGLVGPDGAGKTTAVRVLLGLVSLETGSARVLGHDSAERSRELRDAVGYLSQGFSLYGDLTVAENLEFYGEIHGVKGLKEARERLLTFTQLGPFRARRADKLSGGMQKKLALACTLIHTPKVLFLDEPTTGVDPVARREFWRLLSELLASGLSVLLTTPYLDEAERCGRVALLREGRALACDSPAALRTGLGERVLEVICAPVRLARERLRASDRVLEVQLFGDRLHVVPRRGEDDLADLLRSLDGVHVSEARWVEPSLEDVFIRRVTDAAGEAARV